MIIARILLTACLAAGVLGCGQKGPLVMPDAQKHKRTIPAPPAPKAAPGSGAASPAPAGAGSTPASTPATAPAPTPATPPSTPP